MIYSTIAGIPTPIAFIRRRILTAMKETTAMDPHKETIPVTTLIKPLTAILIRTLITEITIPDIKLTLNIMTLSAISPMIRITPDTAIARQ